MEAAPQPRYGAQVGSLGELPDLPNLPDESSKPAEATPSQAVATPSPGPDLQAAKTAGPQANLPAAPEQAVIADPVPSDEAGGWVSRSKSLELTAREADQHTRRGFELASRNAYFSARAEFLVALRLVAAGLDAEHQTDRHSRALAAAMTALGEAEDFVPRPSQVEPAADLSALLQSHRTRVLHDVPPQSVTAMSALQAYHAFAQEQLAVAAGREVAGSMALCALGKVHRVMADKEPGTVVVAEAKGIVFFQAALLVNPRNYLASNELGVLLAQGGHYEDARTALEHSASLRQQPAIWHNLAVVYQQLGQADLARRAQWLADHGGRPATAAGHVPVRWVDPASFSRTAATTPETVTPITNGQRTSAPTPSATANPPSDRRASAVQPADDPPIRLCQAMVPVACPNCGGATASPGGPSGYAAVSPGGPSGYAAASPGGPSGYAAVSPGGPSGYAAVSPGGHAGFAAGAPGYNWEAARELTWQAYAQGEYVVHARTAHVSEYRLRVDDQLDMVYRLTREETPDPYRLNVGDEIRVESFTDGGLNHDLILQPDGSITLRLLGQVKATGLTVTQVTDKLEKAYLKYYKVPAITVTPLKVNTKLDDLRAAVDRRQGTGGQSQLVRITPEGTVSLPAVGCVPAQGLTLPEFQQELNERYRRVVEGIEVVPALSQRASRYVYVLGEVHTPGRYELLGPTTTIQAITLAGSWNVGANLRQIVILRRGDDWRPLATMLDLHRALYAKDLCPTDEIWLNDSDVVLVPKKPILQCDEFISLVFTRGIYGVIPFTTNMSFAAIATL